MNGPSSPPPVDDVLRAAGLTTLGEDPPLEAVETTLSKLAELADGEPPGRRALLRDGAVQVLHGLVRSPARVVDGFLEPGYPEGVEATEDPEEEVEPEELYEAGRAILEAPDQLALFRASLARLRYAGDTAAAELVHVALNSRALERPIGLALQGPSSAGKSFTVETVARHHPADAMIDISGMSERFLVYASFPTQNRYVSIAEASALHQDGVGATLIRELAWGARLRYGTVVPTDDGPAAVVIERPGPTGLITTTTRELDPEIATRLLAVHVTDAPEQTRAIVAELARTAEGDVEDELDFSAWHASSDWLAFHGEPRVVVPFARALAAKVPTESVRMRRDFEQILTVVRTVAFLHQQTRERDADGRVVATIDDYANAHRLLAETLAVTIDQVSDTVRETVEKLEETCEGLLDDQGVSGRELASELGLTPAGVSYRVKRAGEFIVNLEARPGYPARYRPGDPLPEDRAVLPHPSEIDPPNASKHLNGSPETRKPLGKRTVKDPIETGGPIKFIGPTHSNPPLNAENPQAAAEKSAPIKALNADEGGRHEGGEEEPKKRPAPGIPYEQLKQQEER